MAWAASIATDEAPFLKQVTSNEVSNSEVLFRAALIAGAEKRQVSAASDTLKSLRVRVFGSVAIAEGSELWSDIGSGGRDHIVRFDASVHCGGEWRLKTTIVSTPGSQRFAEDAADVRAPYPWKAIPPDSGVGLGIAPDR